jgi:2-polyprenyl-3-methyl-5-hydroxy-6-metoxy-1,4-benzoquinol methylase
MTTSIEGGIAHTVPQMDLEDVRACPVCGDARRALLHDGLEDRIFGAVPGRWRLWRCQGCRCAYLDPRPTRESIGAAYSRYFARAVEEPAAPEGADRLRESIRNGYLNARYDYAFEPAQPLGRVLMPLFPKRRWNAALTVRGLQKPPDRPRLLDVGFGDGSFLRFMRAGGWEVAGLEVDEQAVDAARSTGIDARAGTLEQPPYEPETFDAITLSHVVEHLHDPVRCLEGCRRLLRPGGVLWLATPNLDGPGARRFGADWFGLDPPRHLVLFNLGAIRHAVTAAGFVGLKHPRTYRAALVLAGSEALASGGNAASATTPNSPQLRRLARALDVAAAVHPRLGEELVVVARKPR